MLDAVIFGHDQMQVVIETIEEFAKDVGVQKWPLIQPSEINQKIFSEIEKRTACQIFVFVSTREQIKQATEAIRKPDARSS